MSRKDVATVNNGATPEKSLTEALLQEQMGFTERWKAPEQQRGKQRRAGNRGRRARGLRGGLQIASAWKK
ncbi:hypothetical protein NDU88_000944 [Pleurodeles waltl]|uniref:Uncharacterized protein n=1 Tax=Pleurodeles waltl TaxID=8319 RepID=A0AAV7WK17_PLEWA|nr:hypothetical protein NDU88_000944 [Pleurodeles waltl]